MAPSIVPVQTQLNSGAGFLRVCGHTYIWKALARTHTSPAPSGGGRPLRWKIAISRRSRQSPDFPLFGQAACRGSTNSHFQPVRSRQADGHQPSRFPDLQGDVDRRRPTLRRAMQQARTIANQAHREYGRDSSVRCMQVRRSRTGGTARGLARANPRAPRCNDGNGRARLTNRPGSRRRASCPRHHRTPSP